AHHHGSSRRRTAIAAPRRQACGRSGLGLCDSSRIQLRSGKRNTPGHDATAPWPAPPTAAVRADFKRRSIVQARKDSNPQPDDLESTALPIELLPFALRPRAVAATACAGQPRSTGSLAGQMAGATDEHVDQVTIFTTRPAPTVRPPSRMAKRWCSSIAI